MPPRGARPQVVDAVVHDAAVVHLLRVLVVAMQVTHEEAHLLLPPRGGEGAVQDPRGQAAGVVAHLLRHPSYQGARRLPQLLETAEEELPHLALFPALGFVQRVVEADHLLAHAAAGGISHVHYVAEEALYGHGLLEVHHAPPVLDLLQGHLGGGGEAQGSAHVEGRQGIMEQLVHHDGFQVLDAQLFHDLGDVDVHAVFGRLPHAELIVELGGMGMARGVEHELRVHDARVAAEGPRPLQDLVEVDSLNAQGLTSAFRARSPGRPGAAWWRWDISPVNRSS